MMTLNNLVIKKAGYLSAFFFYIVYYYCDSGVITLSCGGPLAHRRAILKFIMVQEQYTWRYRYGKRNH